MIELEFGFQLERSVRERLIERVFWGLEVGGVALDDMEMDFGIRGEGIEIESWI